MPKTKMMISGKFKSEDLERENVCVMCQIINGLAMSLGIYVRLPYHYIAPSQKEND